MNKHRIELGAARAATCGPLGPIVDRALGIMLPGLSAD